MILTEKWYTKEITSMHDLYSILKSSKIEYLALSTDKTVGGLSSKSKLHKSNCPSFRSLRYLKREKMPTTKKYYIVDIKKFNSKINKCRLCLKDKT